MWRMPSWASPPDLSGQLLGHLLAGLGRMEIVAAPIGVERAEQPVPLDHFEQAAKARGCALLLDQKGRADRAGRIVHRHDEVDLALQSRQPEMARTVLVQHQAWQRPTRSLLAMR
jgi:hypothetical protein